MTLDFGRGPYTAIKTFFPECRIYPCFYHMMQRLLKNLPEINNKNIKIKLEAKNLLANMKLLCFINNEKIDDFYLMIKKNIKKFF